MPKEREREAQKSPEVKQNIASEEGLESGGKRVRQKDARDGGNVINLTSCFKISS